MFICFDPGISFQATKFINNVGNKYTSINNQIYKMK